MREESFPERQSLLSLLWWIAIGVAFFWMMRRGGCGMSAHGHGGGAGPRQMGDDERLRAVSGEPE